MKGGFGHSYLTAPIRSVEGAFGLHPRKLPEIIALSFKQPTEALLNKSIC